ncbi:TetR/AcrR family transcriptional regulator [candidate division TA06 bacterium]|nr:TetR/AcrR family transcriptional regulator [candidate division TA06 bacterium]
MISTENSGAKKKILRAAERLFAQHGYDGTSVDQIAALARVNKALIYYYYKNKQALLAAMFESLIADIGGSLDAVLDLIGEAPPHANSHIMRPMVTQIIEYLDTKKSVVRILMMESLKTDDEDPMLFRLIERLMSDMVKKLASRGIILDHDYQQTLLEEFFTGTLPLAAFVVYHDQWKKHFKIRESDLKQRFIDMFMDIHVHHSHKRSFGPKGEKP